MKRLVFVTAIALVLGFAPGAHATLTGYDNGLFVYDSTTNLTWYDPLPTPMTWSVAHAWAQSLSVTINGISVTGWRLPMTPATTPGYIDEGEMGHLYYDALGNTATTYTDGLANTGPFANLYPDDYWSGTQESGTPGFAWDFNFFDGYQSAYDETISNYFELAVISGNVAAPVPEPVSLFLFGAGLVGMAVINRKNKKEEV